MRARALSFSRVVLAGLALLAAPASAVTVDWVVVGDPGNAADTPSSNCYAASCGSVAGTYRISKYEVTNAQYVEFLNLKAKADPLGLYNSILMGGNAFGGITRSGVSGSYTYAVKAGFADKPVNAVSFYDSLRFTNWLNNGQGSGDTETGAYTLLGGTATPSNGTTVTRNSGAIVFLPNENEWYKAAYYGALSATYFNYPAGTDTATVCSAPTGTANRANCGGTAGTVTDVGAYTGSASPYGTFDQGGNVFEWNETIASGFRGFRGGNWSNNANPLAASSPSATDPSSESVTIGFRVARFHQPSPPEAPVGGIAGPVVAALLAMTGSLGIAYRQRRRARARNALVSEAGRFGTSSCKS